MNVGGSCAPRAMVPIDQFRETRRQQQPSESNWLTDFFIYYLKTSRSSAVTCYSLSHASKRSLVSAGQARFPQASAEPKSSQRNCQLPTPILPPVISPTSPPAQSTATLNNSLGSNFIVRHIPDDPSNISRQPSDRMGSYTAILSISISAQSDTVAAIPGNTPGLSRTDSSFASLDWVVAGGPPRRGGRKREDSALSA